MRQQSFWGAEAGQARMDEGIARVGGRHGAFLGIARAAALEIARQRGQVTSDDLRKHLEARGVEPLHPNAWGAVFRGCPGLRWSGRYIKSHNASRHRGTMRVWVLA